MLRGIAVAAFIAFAAIIIMSLNPLVWRTTGSAGVFTALLDFTVGLRNVLTLLIIAFIEFASTVSAYVAGFLTHQDAAGLVIFFRDAITAYFQAFGFSFAPAGLDPFDYITRFLLSLYFLAFWILLIIAIMVGITSFLRVSGRLATLCFVSMIGLAILGTAGIILNIPGSENGYFLPSAEFIWPLSWPILFVALVSFIYLEASYQVVYFYSLLEPVTLREEQLQRQITQLQTDAQRQVPVQKEEIPVPKALQRMLGSDAFQLMRQVIERKLLRREWLVELKDAHEVRRLNRFVTRLFREDPEAEAALTARASTPSLYRMTVLSIGSSAIRFFFVLLIAFICLNPVAFLSVLNAPPIIIESIELLFLPEKTLLFLVPLALLFPLASSVIGYIRQQRAQPAEPIRPTITQ